MKKLLFQDVSVTPKTPSWQFEKMGERNERKTFVLTGY